MSKKSLGLILGFAAVAVIFAAVFFGKGGTFKGEFGDFTESVPPAAETSTTTEPAPCGQEGQPPCSPTQQVPPTSGTGYPILPCGGEEQPCPAPQPMGGVFGGQAGGFTQQGSQLPCGGPYPPCLPYPTPPTSCSLTNCDLMNRIAILEAKLGTQHNNIDLFLRKSLWPLLGQVDVRTAALATQHGNTQTQIAALAHNLATMNEGVVKLINTRADQLQVQNRTNTSYLRSKLCILAGELKKTGVHPLIVTTGVCAATPAPL